MAPSLFWKGYLKLSLVTCAVAMAPAITDREKTRFNMLNRETGNRLRMQMIDGDAKEAGVSVKMARELIRQYGPDRQKVLEAVKRPPMNLP